jgi:hypothetical protein
MLALNTANALKAYFPRSISSPKTSVISRIELPRARVRAPVSHRARFSTPYIEFVQRGGLA